MTDITSADCRKNGAFVVKEEAQCHRAVTISELFEHWKESERFRLKASTFSCYATSLQSYILPFFGEFPVGELDGGAARAFCRKMAQEGRIHGKGGLSPATIRHLMVCLRRLLDFGTKAGLIPETPTLTCPRQGRREVSVFTSSQRKRLNVFLKERGGYFCLGIRVCMYTGLRIGELAGLQWGDFQPEQGVIQVRRTVGRIRNVDVQGLPGAPKTRLQVDSPKTASSIREIPLPPFLKEELTALTPPENPECYLLTNSGRCMDPRSIQLRYQKYLAQCGLPYRSFHSLRHGFATMCIEQGFDYKTLSELLGHSSVATTMGIYVHSNMELKRSYMSRLEE